MAANFLKKVYIFISVFISKIHKYGKTGGTTIIVYYNLIIKKKHFEQFNYMENLFTSLKYFTM